MAPVEIVNRLVRRFKDRTGVVLFCSVVFRREGARRVPHSFRDLAYQFNTALKNRLAPSDNLHYGQLAHKLHKKLDADGVHVNS